MPVTAWMPCGDVEATFSAIKGNMDWGGTSGYNTLLVGLLGPECETVNGEYASFLQQASQSTRNLRCSDFDFASVLPPTTTAITGMEIEATIERDSTGTYVVTQTEVYEHKASGQVTTSPYVHIADWPVGGFVATVWGSSASIPEATSYADAIDPLFGCDIQVTLGAGRNSLTTKHLINQIRMRLTYTVADSTPKRGKGAQFQ